ncbi:hypothetical protein Tco_0096813 [Tanacetum coccineum]
MAVKEYLGTNLGVALQKVIQRHTVELILEYFVPADVIEYTIKSSDKAALNEFDQKQALFETMTASKSFNNHPKNMALYHALMESILVGKDAMDQGKSAQVEETVFEATDTDKPYNQGDGTSKQPNVEAAPKKVRFKKPKRPPTPNPEWYQGKSVGNKPTQNWLSDLAKVEKPHLTFNELMSTPIDFPAYAMNRLNINNLTKADLVGPVYNLLKGTCKSCVELEYNMEECYKALHDQLDWNNPEGDRCPFNFSKPLPLIESRVTNVNVNEWYGYGHLEEIEDIMLLIFQNKLFNLNGDVIFDFVVALRMVTRRIVIQKRVEDLQLGIKSYQKKLNISKPITHDEDLSHRASYTTLLDP